MSPNSGSNQKPLRSVGELLRWTEERFGELGMASPRLDAELLLSRAMGVERIELYTGYQKLVEAKERQVFREFVQRRSRYEPVAYILGEREFFSLRFQVNSSVLVPRPETEFIVEKALSFLDGRPDPKVLDLGTGSGNIAVALAAKREDAEIVAVDICPEALKVAKRNVSDHHLDARIHLLRGDLFSPIDGDASFDAIVSNPPYVRADELPGLMPDVRLHEPTAALLDSKSEGSDGLGFYRAIARESGRLLAASGAVIVEVGESQSEDVADIFRKHSFANVECLPDHAAILRVVMADSFEG